MLGGQMAKAAMIDALIDEIKKRTVGLREASIPLEDSALFIREKVTPMIDGFFPATERAIVLAKIEKSVLFLTTKTVEPILRKTQANISWDLCNIFLLSVGAKALSKTGEEYVGMSGDEVCYVAHNYFTENAPFTDFVVHEVAHLFHKLRREQLGLKATPKKKYLLPIKYNQRETFAYACEAYNWILGAADGAKERVALTEELIDNYEPPDDSVDLELYYAALQAAAKSRNGWKKILKMCSD